MLSSYEKEVKERQAEEDDLKKQEEENTRALVALGDVIHSHNGRVVLKQILSFCNPDRDCYTNDPIATAYNEGIRTVGLQIKSWLGKEKFRVIEDEVI